MGRDDRLYGGMTVVSHWDRGDGTPACGTADPQVRPVNFPENVTCPACRKIIQKERERFE